MNIQRYVSAFMMLVSLLLVGCAGASVQPQEQPPTAAEGARIWRQSCNRCHGPRPATEFAADDWELIVSHMRTRADLTRSEAEAVAAFLRSTARAGA